MTPLELKKIRQEFNLTQEDLAFIAGKKVRSVQSWEQGQRKMPQSAIMLINNYIQANTAQITPNKEVDTVDVIPFNEENENLEIIENSFGNKFEKLPNGQYLMYMPLFEWDVAASLLDNNGDVTHPDYAEIAQHTMVVDGPLRGHYVGFRIKGDSMFDGTDRSIKDGDIVTGRELQRVHWSNKLHLSDRKLWIVASTMFGRPTLKEIVEHDIKRCVIVCDSWNPSVEYAHNVEVSLNSVTSLYYAVDVSRPLNKKFFS